MAWALARMRQILEATGQLRLRKPIMEINAGHLPLLRSY